MNEPRDIAVMLGHGAVTWPDKPALCFVPAGPVVTDQLSYAELYAQSLQLAAAMRAQLGLQERARVLIMLNTSLDYALAFLAGVCAGLVPVPLFPLPGRRPRHFDRLRSVVTDAQPSLCICAPDVTHTVQAWLDELELPCRAISMQELRTSVEARGVSLAPRALEPAYLQYTSGSTSRPKGVQVGQANLLVNAQGLALARGLTSEDVLVTFIPLYHDMGLIAGLIMGLCVGMTVYLMPTQSFIRSPRRWLDVISRFGGSVSLAPDFAYRLCARTLDDAAVSGLDLRSLRHAISGGEPIHPSTLRAFEERFAPAGFEPRAFAPAFGQAEATLCISCPLPGSTRLELELDREALALRQVRSVATAGTGLALSACGPVIAEHEIAIVNPDTFVRCGPDEVGEIWFRGPSVTAGYFERPLATRETFGASITAEGGGYLRTGDLGFLRSQQLFVCGRLKDLIILAGRNVYPHDLELAVTRATPGLRAGRVVAFSTWNEALGRQELWLVAEAEQRKTAAAHSSEMFANMQAACAEVAEVSADRMLLVKSGSVPLTSSGKLSRSATRELALGGRFDLVADSARPLWQRAELAQASDSERGSLCLQWFSARVMWLRPATEWNAGASFLELGCDSLALTQLMQELRGLGYEVSARELFGDLSVAEHAARWAEQLQQSAASEPEQPALAPLPLEVTTYRLSSAQRRLWFLQELEPERTDAHISLCLRLRGPLEAQALERSLQWLVERHAVLRTRYVSRPDGAAAECQPRASLQLQQDDLRGLRAGELALRREQILLEERARPFPLRVGLEVDEPAALRARLLRQADEQHELILTLHHLAVDGRSAALVMADLDRVYAAAASGNALPSARGPQFLPREHDDAALAAQAQQFHRAQLAELARELCVPAPAANAREHYRRFSLSRELGLQLEQLARAERTTPFLLLLSLFGVSLRYVSGQTGFVIGTDLAGRSSTELRDVVGFFVNQLPLRCDVSGELSLRELIARQREAALAAYAYEQVPFDAIAGTLPGARARAEARPFGLKLNYQPAYLTRTKLGPLHIDRADVHQERGSQQLVLDLVRQPDGSVQACLEANASISDALAQRIEWAWLLLVQELPQLLAANMPALLEHLARAENLARESALADTLDRQGAGLQAARRRPLATRTSPELQPPNSTEKP